MGRLLARDVRDSRPPARVVLVLDDSAAARASIVDALATRLSVPILEADSAACARVRAYCLRPHRICAARLSIEGPT